MRMVLLTALGVGGATIFGALIGFLFKKQSHKFSDIVLSFAAGGSFSLFYWIFEQFPPIYPQIASQPLLAALSGAVFVGVGVDSGDCSSRWPASSPVQSA